MVSAAHIAIIVAATNGAHIHAASGTAEATAHTSAEWYQYVVLIVIVSFFILALVSILSHPHDD